MDPGGATIVVEQTPRLFNDVHFQRWKPPAASRDITWAPFARLPPELRLQVWLTCLRRCRMLELDIWPAADENAATYPGDGSQTRYYTNCNALGNVISGRGYMWGWRGRHTCYAGSYSPLLWVNHEARQATLGFYRVHLPFFGLQREQVLYLNPVHDVVSIQPRRDEDGTIRFKSLPLLADFLHDVKAYDPKGQGVAHLALNDGFLTPKSTDDGSLLPCFQLTPAALHPAAAASFTDILQRRLRSVFLVIGFRSRYRGMAEVPPRPPVYQYHFAQTFPLARREHPAGTFHWFDADPRPGVEVDIRQMPLNEDPRLLATGWKQLEQAFGIIRSTEQQYQHQAAIPGLRLYVCPRLKWPQSEREHEREHARRWRRTAMRPDEYSGTSLASVATGNWSGPVLPRPQEEAEEEEKEEEIKGPRAELARHLREEADDWQYHRMWLHKVFGSSPGSRMMPKQGYVLDAETFERMERLPCTAVGMWLFPAEAFKQPTIPRRLCFDMSSGIRPGLVLFEV